MERSFSVNERMGKTINKRSDSMSKEAWRKLRKNKPAMIGLLIIVFAALVSILGANVRPDETPDANDINSSIARQNPGFTVKMLLFRVDKEVDDKNFFQKLFFGGQDRVYKHIPMYSYKFEGSDVVVEEFSGRKELSKNYEPQYKRYNIAEVLYPLSIQREQKYKLNLNGTITYWMLDGTEHTKNVQDLRDEIRKYNVQVETFYLGTDKQGRDMLSRLMAGTIISLSVGLISVSISLIIGLFLGALAGYYRGWVDDVIMWLINMVWSIPGLLLIISLTLFLGKGFTTVFIAVGLVMWVDLARLVRGQVLSIREMEYIEAGKALGFSNSRIIWRHILPNIMGPVIVISASNFVSAILLEAGLSYLGIGAQIPMASWGAMIEQHQSYITNMDKAYLAILPGIFIIVLVFAFMLLGNGLRDALDVKSTDDISGT